MAIKFIMHPQLDDYEHQRERRVPTYELEVFADGVGQGEGGVLVGRLVAEQDLGHREMVVVGG